MKIKSLDDWHSRPSAYIVYNWGAPQFISFEPMPAFLYFSRMVSKWGTPLLEGCVSVIRYRPGSEPGVDIQVVDLTSVAFKFAKKHPCIW